MKDGKSVNGHACPLPPFSMHVYCLAWDDPDSTGKATGLQKGTYNMLKAT